MTDRTPVETVFATPAGFADAQADAAHPSPAVLDIDVAGLRVGCFEGIDALLIETAQATAAIALHGGHLLSWTPAGKRDVLWRSPRIAAPPAAIRGGVPVVWPYFGQQGQPGDGPAHGFARTVHWSLLDAAEDADGAVSITLAPPTFLDLGLELRMRLRIGAVLEQTLETTNTGAHAVAFTQALHSYFHVSDVAQVRVGGVDGLAFLDKNDGYATPHVQQGDWRLDDARDPGRSDYVYVDAPGRYVLDDPGFDHRIELSTAGSRSLVVWNPGETAAGRTRDMDQGVWRDFICLEAANAGSDIVQLAPGHTHVLTQKVRVEARD